MRLLDLVIGGIHARLAKLWALIGLHLNADRITDNIWIGGLNSPRVILSEGFNVVMDLREEATDDYRSSLENHGIDYLNVKIPDREGASTKLLSWIIKQIDERVQRGEKILIHCNLGRGRSALVAAAYLVSKNHEPEEAISLIKKKRRVTFLNNQQKQALYEFANALSSAYKCSEKDETG